MSETAAQHERQRLLDRIETHDKDLAELRADISAVTQSVKYIADGQKLLGGKLDELTQALGSRGKASVSEVSAYLQVVALLFAIIGGTVTGIVYIASNASAARVDEQRSRVELLEYKLNRLYGSFGWQPEIKRAAPGN